MSKELDLAVLDHLIKNTELLEGAALGIAKLLKDKGTMKALSPAQLAVFEKHIYPHLHPKCTGVFDQGCTNFGGFIDDESVLLSYQEDTFLCQLCRYDRDKIKESP